MKSSSSPDNPLSLDPSSQGAASSSQEMLHDQVREALNAMRRALENTPHPQMKAFWESKKQCLSLFKDLAKTSSRSALWTEYLQLTQEAQGMKAILEEQSAFAVEQMGLAVEALEQDVQRWQEKLQALAFPTFSHRPISLEGVWDFYQQSQREIAAIQAFISRLQTMREETLALEIRIRTKNQLLDRIERVGDFFFPRRKEQILGLSKHFAQYVSAFIEEFHLCKKERKIPIFSLKEEIKSFQALAKELSLNSETFLSTREKLSLAWDELKELEQERKKIFLEKKQVFRAHCDQMMQKIEQMETDLKASEASFEQVREKVQEIEKEMRNLSLGREEVQSLKNRLQAILKPYLDRESQKKLALEKAEAEKKAQLRQSGDAAIQKAQDLLQSGKSVSLQEILSEFQTLQESVDSRLLLSDQRKSLDTLYKAIQNLILQKKQQHLLSLSEEDKGNFELLQQHLLEAQARRTQLKAQLESYRKLLGGSQLDFEKAMQYQELVSQGKLELEQINQMMEELQEKMERI